MSTFERTGKLVSWYPGFAVETSHRNLARMVIPGEGPAGLPGDLVIGVVGVLVGGWIFNIIGHPGATGTQHRVDHRRLVGAVVVLWLTRLFTGRRTARLAYSMRSDD